ncbi:TIGR03086 family metal-binding protein [Streptomyces erythrochromogenes]|uniref:TIGR03086 family metal-binding protein n=1 Tax=Streptomyces erythrochromogenes TaxID=285574 RepID=A0ABZ1Q482_9ACTN|nr:TIGR03086 family metal-binding protein [Streptomyces erythrochromogenes]MCX5583680.1 TIGR03086 family metal-binding protein [Streptomyces erythrochromogenes]
MTVDGFKLLADAHDYLLTAVRGVPAEAWADPTPCTEWTVRQVLNHARLDQQALVMQITGAAPESDPFEPEDATAGDPVAELAAVLEATAAAWESRRDDESVPTPMGPMPADVGTAAAALDAGIHAWDIARATGQDLPLTEEMAEALEDIAARIVDFVRDSFGKYAPPLVLPEGASRAEKLLAFTGRDPRWSR